MRRPLFVRKASPSTQWSGDEYSTGPLWRAGPKHADFLDVYAACDDFEFPISICSGSAQPGRRHSRLLLLAIQIQFDLSEEVIFAFDLDLASLEVFEVAFDLDHL